MEDIPTISLTQEIDQPCTIDEKVVLSGNKRYKLLEWEVDKRTSFRIHTTSEEKKREGEGGGTERGEE